MFLKKPIRTIPFSNNYICNSKVQSNLNGLNFNASVFQYRHVHL